MAYNRRVAERGGQFEHMQVVSGSLVKPAMTFAIKAFKSLWVGCFIFSSVLQMPYSASFWVSRQLRGHHVRVIQGSSRRCNM